MSADPFTREDLPLADRDSGPSLDPITPGDASGTRGGPPPDRYRDQPDVGYEPSTPPGAASELRVYPLPDRGHDPELEGFVPAPGGALRPDEVSPHVSGAVSSVPNSGTTTTDALLSGVKWGGSVGTAATVQYSFPSGGATWTVNYGPGSEPYSGFVPLSATQQNAARKALRQWDEVSNLNFVEIADTSTNVGDVRFGNSDDPSTAWAYYPSSNPVGGDVWFGKNFNYSSDVDGTYSLATFIHEIGHAIGLKHPHEGDGSGVVMPASSDYLGHSIMSYRSYLGASTSEGYSNSFFPTTAGVFDIAATQYMYGANTTTRSGNTTYKWGTGEQLFETIWDAGGKDTIDWSNQSTGAEIRLISGSWSKLGPGYSTSGGFDTNTLNIAYGATIENARGGKVNDSLYGNGVANSLFGNAGNDYCFGDAGNDKIEGGKGSDTLDGWTGNDVIGGGNGNDTLLGYSGNDALGGGPGNDVLRGEDGNDRLTGGLGKDTFYGNAGKDIFDFNTKTESAVGANRDVIAGFDNVGASAGDCIDLSTIDAKDGTSGNQAFVWRGAGAFTGAGQLRYAFSGSDTIISGNTDSDSTPEFQLALSGHHFMIADDFVL
jgi:serralysin